MSSRYEFIGSAYIYNKENNTYALKYITRGPSASYSTYQYGHINSMSYNGNVVYLRGGDKPDGSDTITNVFYKGNIKYTGQHLNSLESTLSSNIKNTANVIIPDINNDIYININNKYDTTTEYVTNLKYITKTGLQSNSFPNMTYSFKSKLIEGNESSRYPDKYPQGLSSNKDGTILVLGKPWLYNIDNQNGVVNIYDSNLDLKSVIYSPLTDSDVRAGFGYSVSMSYNGNGLAIGAPLYTKDNVNKGFVYTYKRTSNFGYTGTRLDIPDSLNTTGMGERVHIQGNTLIVLGSHLLEYKLTNGIWKIVETSTITLEETNNISYSKLSKDKKYLYIAYKNKNIGENTNVGIVNIYYKDEDTWSLLQTISGVNTNDELGVSLDISKDNNKLIVSGVGTDELGYINIYQYNVLTKLYELVDIITNTFTNGKYLGLGLGYDSYNDSIFTLYKVNNIIYSALYR